MKNITILGCGAIGSRLALELASPDVHMKLYDHDKVADDNIGTSAYSRYDIGKQKAWALAAMVGTRKGMSEGIHIDITRKGAIRTNEKIDLIIDCLDNAKARNMLRAMSVSYPLVHVGVAENVGEVMFGLQIYDPAVDGLHVCTHMLGRNIICLTAAVAARAVENYLRNGTQKNYLINESGKVMF